MKYYTVKYDSDNFFLRRPHVAPSGNIDFAKEIHDEDTIKIVKDYIVGIYSQCFSEPRGVLGQPYLVPGGGYTSLWDWDSFFMSCSIGDDKIEYAKGSICNLLDNMDESGRPAKNLTIDGDKDAHSTPLPIQIQFAYIVAKRLNDFSWVKKYYPKFKKMIKWYDDNCTRNGLYVYRTMHGNGIDNNPAVYCRTDMSTSACDLVALFYRELCAMAKFSYMFESENYVHYKKRAEDYKAFVQNNYFDQMDEFYYSIDCNYNEEFATEQGVGWVTYLKYRNCSSIFPLWAGIASSEQAEKAVKKILDENEFLTVCGIRSHSKADPVYNNVPMCNPSNWQGPVWGLSTFLTAYSLARYGYKQEAYKVAMRLVKTFALDIVQNGCIHEYYHGDNGQPLIRPNFLSWNMLALNIIDDINKGADSTTYDLLDLE